LIARLRQALVQGYPDCGNQPPGPPFVLALEALDGTITGYRSLDLPCFGRVAVAAYLEDLGLQDAELAATGQPEPNCAPPDDGLDTRGQLSDGPPGRTVGGGGGVGRTVICLYPQYDPHSPAALMQRDYHAIRPTAGALTRGFTVAAGSTTQTAPTSCEPQPWRLVLRSWGAEGGPDIEVRSRCRGIFEVLLPGTGPGYNRYWTPDPATASLLSACLKPVPRCE
jgi:hypothetical protein